MTKYIMFRLSKEDSKRIQYACNGIINRPSIDSEEKQNYSRLMNITGVKFRLSKNDMKRLQYAIGEMLNKSSTDWGKRQQYFRLLEKLDRILPIE
jgi:hypothetical protein